MSDFTVGKIANNSVTLILNSDDENVEIGKRIIVADNTFFGTAAGGGQPAGTYYSAEVTIESLSTEVTTVGNRVPADNWFDNVFGLPASPEIVPNNFNGTGVETGEYWVVTAYVAANVAGQIDWRSCVQDGNIPVFSDAQLTGFINDGPFIIKTNFAGAPKTLAVGNRGYKLSVQDEHIGATIRVVGDGVGVHNGTISMPDHSTFKINIPNIINYPNKTRCLVQVNGLFFNRGNTIDNLFICIPELQPLNYYIGGKQGTGIICVVRAAGNNGIERDHPPRDIIQNGVLCQTP
eukprot:SAG11_NODE_4072_length_2078_cov_2404.853967_2_plen_291_part_01